MAENTKLWYLQNFNLLEDMDEKTMMGLDQKSRMQETPKKEIIYIPDEPNNTIYRRTDDSLWWRWSGLGYANR